MSGTNPWRQHLLVYSVFFMMGAELFLLSPLLPTMSADLGSTIAATAWVVTTFGLTYAAASPFVGALTEHLPRRRVMVAGVTLFTAGEALCAFAPTLSWVLCARVVAGLGGALVGPAMWAYLAETSAPSARGRAIARGAAAYAAGQIVGVPLASVLAAGSGWRWAFAALAIGLAVCGVLIARILREPVRAPARWPGAGTALAGSFSLWRQPTFRLILLGNSCAQAARLGTYAFAGAWLSLRFGFGTAQLGTVGAAVGVGSMVGALVAGPVVDRWRTGGGREPVLCVGWALMLGAALAVSVLADTWSICVGGLVLAFFAGSAYFSTSQVFLTTVMAKRRGPAVSWNNSALYLGTAVGTTALGATALGSTTFALCSVGLALAAVCVSAWLTFRGHTPSARASVGHDFGNWSRQ